MNDRLDTGWSETVGRVAAIWLAAGPGETPARVEGALAEAGRGLAGDRYHSGTGTFQRWPEPGKEVTFLAAEAVAALAVDHGLVLPPGGHRRNIETEGADPGVLIGRRFRIGGALFFGERRCLPCGYIERLTGVAGLREALRAVGGSLRARVLESGEVREGDELVALTPMEDRRFLP